MDGLKGVNDIGNNFLNKLTQHLKNHTVEQYIYYSFNQWTEYIQKLGQMDSNISDYIMNKDNKESIIEFVSKYGILNLQYTEDRILKRYIIGFDYDLSIRIKKDITFREYFDCYKEHLNNHPINDSLKLKIILTIISRKVHIVPKLATFDSVENDWERVGYSIYYSEYVSESLTINIRQELKHNLAVLSDSREHDKSQLIEEEMNDFCDLLSRGIFDLIIHDKYPQTLESILPEKEYVNQIKDRILKDETPVKYDGEIYKSIKLLDSYVIVDSNLHAVDDTERAEAIYCKINLSKSMFG